MEVNRRKWWIISLAGTVGFFFAIAPVLDPYIVIEIGSGFTLKINDIIMLFLTMLCFSKSYGQFIKNALNKENIVLKSKGEQRRTYSYVVDVVSGIFKVLFNGLNGEVYNIANENSIASIAEVASICAEIAGTNVVFDLPDKIEKKGFSQSKDCILDNSKLKSLGWNGKYTLKQGLVETIESLREDE